MQKILLPMLIAFSLFASETMAGHVAAPAPSASDRQVILDRIRDTCDERVRQLLGQAMPQAPQPAQVVSAICQCAQKSIAKPARTTPLEDMIMLAATKTLACARPTVVDYGTQAMSAQYSDHLHAQGLNDSQTQAMSRCLSELNWSVKFEAALRGLGGGVGGPAIWQRCAERMGQPAMALPKAPKRAASSVAPSAASAPAASASQP